MNKGARTGRPPLPYDKKTYNLLLPARDFAALQRIAVNQGFSVAVLIRAMIANFLFNHHQGEKR